MNFIIGRNGSGKSTVLTAISTCLGGKASNTQRASSMRSFVKEGKPKAIVQVVFSNEGRGAYESDKYGSSISIERSIIRETGSSSYKIKNYKGKTVSDKRKDLDRILEAFRIQIDNPFAILTQDTARTFLTASSEKAKYDYFRRALLFDKIETYPKTKRT
jgi:chromosome segregation ATPase